MTLVSRASLTAAFLALLVVASLPLFAHAQSTDLSSSVRAALAGDPRTASMSQAQVDAMVAALTQQAQAKGITAQDIAWKPVTDRPVSAGESDCAGSPSLLCNMSAAFGFTGPDWIIALWLGVSALLLIFLIGAFLEYRHLKHLHPVHAEAAGLRPPQA